MEKETQNNKGLVYFINDTKKKELEGMNNVVYSEDGKYALVYTKEILTEAKFQYEALKADMIRSSVDDSYYDYIYNTTFEEVGAFPKKLGEPRGKILEKGDTSMTFHFDKDLPVVCLYNIKKFENDIVECEIIAQAFLAKVNEKRTMYARKFNRN